MVVKGEDCGVSNPSFALFIFFCYFLSFDFFFYFFFHLIFSSLCINLNFLLRKSSQMLLNQTGVAVDEELEEVIITMDSCTETADIGDNESG